MTNFADQKIPKHQHEKDQESRDPADSNFDHQSKTGSSKPKEDKSKEKTENDREEDQHHFKEGHSGTHRTGGKG